MSTDHLTFLCLSFRGSERVSTDTGARLDTLRHRESAFDALVASGLPASQARRIASTWRGRAPWARMSVCKSSMRMMKPDASIQSGFERSTRSGRGGNAEA